MPQLEKEYRVRKCMLTYDIFQSVLFGYHFNLERFSSINTLYVFVFAQGLQSQIKEKKIVSIFYNNITIPITCDY